MSDAQGIPRHQEIIIIIIQKEEREERAVADVHWRSEYIYSIRIIIS